MLVATQTDSILASRARGSYDCRRAVWDQAKALKVEEMLFNKEERSLLSEYFDCYESEPNLDGFHDRATAARRFPVDYNERHRIVAALLRRLIIRLDERAAMWLDDLKSSKTLAFLPVDWKVIILLRRNEIRTLPQVIDKPDAVLRKMGLTPTTIKRIRTFYDKQCPERPRQPLRKIQPSLPLF